MEKKTEKQGIEFRMEVLKCLTSGATTFSITTSTIMTLSVDGLHMMALSITML